MASHSKRPSWLANDDSRPFVVTLAAAGWLLLYGLVAINAVGVQVNGAAQSVAAEHVRVPAIDAYDAMKQREESMREENRAFLDRMLAAALVVVSGVVITGAIALLRRKSWSAKLLWGTGAAAIAASALHTHGLLQFDADQAAGLPGAEEALAAVSAVAYINVAIQSLPTVILMGLLRHPAARGYLAARDATDPSEVAGSRS